MRCAIGNTIINYEVRGSGKPILLFSGFINDMTTMMNCMEPIFCNKEGWKRIYVDHLGVGETSIGEEVKNLEDVFNVITQFVEKVIENEEFVLAGYSFGGYLSRYILNQKFNKVKGLLLINPLIVKNLEECDVDREVDEIEIEDIREQQRIENRILIDMKKASARTDFNFLRTLQEQSRDMNVFLEEFEKPFERPTLIITGRQDTTVGYRDAYKILDKYTRATFCVIDKCGHAVQIEQESLFNCLVEEWLNRVNEA